MPRGPKGEHRPADVVGCAVTVAKIATGEREIRQKDLQLIQETNRQIAEWSAQRDAAIAEGNIALAQRHNRMFMAAAANLDANLDVMRREAGQQDL